MSALLMDCEAAFAVATAFLAAAMLLSSAAWAGETAERSLSWMEKQLEADALADFIAVHLVDSNGDLLLQGIGELRLDSTQVVLGGAVFGSDPPAGKSTFVARRLVRNAGALTVLEVRRW